MPEHAAQRVIRLLTRPSLLDSDLPDPLAQEQPLMAGLVLPPRLRRITYHGVPAPYAADGKQIVPGASPSQRPRLTLLRGPVDRPQPATSPDHAVTLTPGTGSKPPM